MAVTNNRFVAVQPVTLGWIIAIIVLLLAIVFMAIGKLDYVTGGLIGGLAIARLV